MKNLSPEAIVITIIVFLVIFGVSILSITGHIQVIRDLEVSTHKIELETEIEMYRIRASFIDDIYKTEDIPARLEALDNK